MPTLFRRIPARSGTWVLALLFAGLFALKLWAIYQHYPDTDGDEIIYSEPAVAFAQEGHFALPALARQIELKYPEVDSLDCSFHLTPPVALWLRLPPILAFGTGMETRRLADALILLGVFSAFFFAVKRFSSYGVTFLTLLAFGLHPRVLWATPGRPDLAGLMFGLLAFLAVSGRKTPRVPIPLHILGGFLVGLGFLCHPFSGIVWAIAIWLVIAFGTWPDWKRLCLDTLACILGGILSLTLWGAFIAGDYESWHQQFFWMLEVKRSMGSNPVTSLWWLCKDTVLRNPFVCFVVLAGFAFGPGKTLRLRLAFLFALLIGGLYRIMTVEPWFPAYHAHFWAMLCLMFALSIPASKNEGVPWNSGWFFSPLLRICTAVLIILTGVLTTYNRIAELVFLPHRQQSLRIESLLKSHINPGDRVLSECAHYFDIPSKDRWATEQHETLDLLQFDVVVTTTNPPTMETKQPAVWRDSFSPSQVGQIQSGFELVASAPCIYLPETLQFLKYYRPHTTAAYIFRRKASVDAGSPEEKPKN